MVVAAAVWAESFRNSHASFLQRNLVALVSSAVTPKHPLLKGFDQILRVDPFPELVDNSFLLLHVWDLTSYDKVVYVDVLSVFVESVTRLFTEYHAFAAAPAVYPTDKFSADVMVIQPNSTMAADMVARASSWVKRGSWDRSCEAFLNDYFWDWYESSSKHRLPIGFHTDFWFKSGMAHYFNPFRIVHFDHRAKPWGPPTLFNVAERKRMLRLWYTTLCQLDNTLLPPDFRQKCSRYGKRRRTNALAA